MSEVLNILNEFKEELRHTSWGPQTLSSSLGKVKLYIDRFFPKSQRYQSDIEAINANPENQQELNDSVAKISAITEVLIADASIRNELKVMSIVTYDSLIKERDNALRANSIREETVKVMESNIRKLTEQLENFAELEKTRKQQESILKGELANIKSENTHLEGIKEKSDAEVELIKSGYNVESAKNQALNEQLKEAILEVSTLKEFKQKHEIAKNSLNFKVQAEANSKNASYWRWAVIASLAIFVIFVYCGFVSNEELLDIAQNIHLKTKGVGMNDTLTDKVIYLEMAKKIGSKALIYSMIIYLISFFVKNYNAQMHNFVVNSHKSNALSSTVDLIGTAKSNDGNDKILEQATQAIFTTQKSGYQGADSEPNNPNFITNVIDAVKSK